MGRHACVWQITGDIVRKLKNKKCKGWGDKKNPLDVDIQPNNCAKHGIPTYFDVIKEPMNLVMMQVSHEKSDRT